MLGAQLLADGVDREKIAAERQGDPEKPNNDKEEGFHGRSVARSEAVVNVEAPARRQNMNASGNGET